MNFAGLLVRSRWTAGCLYIDIRLCQSCLFNVKSVAERKTYRAVHAAVSKPYYSVTLQGEKNALRWLADKCSTVKYPGSDECRGQSIHLTA